MFKRQRTDSSRKKLIGLVGYPSSGKDALASELCLWGGFTRYAFGDAVKSLLLATDKTYGNSLERLENWKRKGINETRERLQRLGQTLRDFDEDFWVKSMPETLAELAVVTDVRYDNELQWVKDKGGIVVAIHRPGYGPVNDHKSETNTTRLLDMADTTLTNNGTIKELAARCRTIL
jgi:hypothetical protein